jgi:hypothetical protein
MSQANGQTAVFKVRLLPFLILACIVREDAVSQGNYQEFNCQVWLLEN